MKGKTLITLGIIVAAIGAVLIICHRSITTTGVVITGGVLFMAVGLINLIIYGQNSSKEGYNLGHLFAQIANAAAIVLGICMLVFESTFSPLVPFIFGLLIAVCALWEFFLLALGTRPYILPGWLYIFPLMLAGGATYIFIQKSAAEHLIMLVTGISLAVLGGACIIQGSALGMARRAAIKAKNEPAASTNTIRFDDLDDVKNSQSSTITKHTAERLSETTDDLDDPSELPSDDPKSEK